MKFTANLNNLFLKPGELSFVKEPTLIRTVLGSCITITMRTRGGCIAAACHPVLPVCREVFACQPRSCINKFKYVECVVPEMVKRFSRLGVRHRELEMKLFGGAQLLHPAPDNKNNKYVGGMNVSMAMQMIDELKVTLKSRDVGGEDGRKIIFDTGTGEVWLKRFKGDFGDMEKLQTV